MEENKNEKTEVQKKSLMNDQMKPILIKSLFIIAILVLIIVLAFSVIRFMPVVFSSLASVGSAIKSPFEKGLVLKVNEANLNTGETFRLYFEYTPKETGHYNLSYDCAPNLSLAVVRQTDSVLECNKLYRIAPNDTFIDLKAILNKENFYTETDINVSYTTRDQKELESDSITISVVNEVNVPINDLSASATISSQGVTSGQTNTTPTTQTQTNTTQTTPTTSTTQTSQTSNTRYVSNIPADLAITNARALNNTTVVFDVSNIGGKASGNWYFNYTIPNERVETSPLQMSLNPGEVMRFTLRFVDVDSGSTVIMIDPRNFIRENSESNNNATIYIRGDGGGSGSNYDYDRNDDADLVIEDLEVGRMRGSRFVEDNEIDEDDDAAVRFMVTNIGGESTGSWRFEIDNTPYDDNDEYRSSRQSSLRPGESREIIVEFENPDEGRYRIKVTVDSDDDVDEENERNNDETATLRVVR